MTEGISTILSPRDAALLSADIALSDRTRRAGCAVH